MQLPKQVVVPHCRFFARQLVLLIAVAFALLGCILPDSFTQSSRTNENAKLPILDLEGCRMDLFTISEDALALFICTQSPDFSWMPSAPVDTPAPANFFKVRVMLGATNLGVATLGLDVYVNAAAPPRVGFDNPAIKTANLRALTNVVLDVGTYFQRSIALKFDTAALAASAAKQLEAASEPYAKAPPALGQVVYVEATGVFRETTAYPSADDLRERRSYWYEISHGLFPLPEQTETNQIFKFSAGNIDSTALLDGDIVRVKGWLDGIHLTSKPDEAPQGVHILRVKNLQAVATPVVIGAGKLTQAQAHLLARRIVLAHYRRESFDLERSSPPELVDGRWAFRCRHGTLQGDAEVRVSFAEDGTGRTHNLAYFSSAVFIRR